MTAEEKMTIDERWKYLRKMKARYAQADRKERGHLLDEMEVVTGMHRKGLVRRLKGSLVRQPRHKERTKTYQANVTDALRVIVASLDYPCAERLTPNLVWMAEHLTSHGELDISDQVLKQLGQISISTVGRRLATIGQDRPRRRRGPPKAPNRALPGAPMGRIGTVPCDDTVGELGSSCRNGVKTHKGRPAALSWHFS